jgi:uncharacterized membrane protein
MAEVGGTLYTVLRVLHILGAVGFLGGLAMSVYWKLAADRSTDAGFASAVHRRLRRADAQIIAPSALVTFAAGYAMIRFFGSRIAEHAVALWGLILMFLALALWYFGMRRLGTRLAADAEASFEGGQRLTHEYAQKSVAYLALALAATALVLTVAIMMIVAPPRP